MGGPGEEVTQWPSVTSSCPELPAGLGWDLLGWDLLLHWEWEKVSGVSLSHHPTVFWDFLLGFLEKWCWSSPSVLQCHVRGHREGWHQTFPLPTWIFPFAIPIFHPTSFPCSSQTNLILIKPRCVFSNQNSNIRRAVNAFPFEIPRKTKEFST